jgi:hypothetical protein
MCANQLCEEGVCTLESSGVRCMGTGGCTPWHHMAQEGASRGEGQYILNAL